METRPPLWLDASYTLTAFSRAVEDEHRLLSQALTALSSYPELPEDVLPAPLAGLKRQFGALQTRAGDSRHDATPDFWHAVGGAYKLSFHYIVTVPFPSGSVLHRGPPVREQQVRVSDRLARRPAVVERTRIRGSVVDSGGTGVAGAWVMLRDLGRVAETDELGRFSFTQVPPGSHVVCVRDAEGHEAEERLDVPGEPPTVVLPIPGADQIGQRPLPGSLPTGL
jgi:hypothetical protein